MNVATKLEIAQALIEMGILKDSNDYIKFLNSEDFLKELELLEKVKHTKLYKALK